LLMCGDPYPGGDDPWSFGDTRLYAVITRSEGNALFELNPANPAISQYNQDDWTLFGSLPPGDELQFCELRDGSGFPGVLVKGDTDWLFIAGHLREAEPGVNRRLMAMNVRSAAWFPEDPPDSLATAVLVDNGGADLYCGADLLHRIDCANRSLRPVQYGDSEALELAFLTPEGEIRIFNQQGVEIARSVESFPGARSWISAGRENLEMAFALAEEHMLQGLDAYGDDLSTWPRVMPPLAGGVMANPGGTSLMGLGFDGLLHAWETESTDWVWTQEAGNPNRGWRPVSHGSGIGEAVAEVHANRAFVWPNPAGDTAHFRFRQATAAEVELRIYDLAGDLKHRIRDAVEPVGGEDAELVWDTRPFSPGAYLCVLEVRPRAGGTVDASPWSRVIKCAVIR